MTQPELLAYPSDRNPHIPAIPVEGGTPPPYPASEVVRTIGEFSLFPIAEDTTLPPDFYDNVDIDVRYARDRERVESLSQLRVLARHEEDPEIQDILESAYPLFAVSLFESDYLVAAFAPPRGSVDTLSSEEKRKFFSPFVVSDAATAQEMNARLYGVPSDIRSLAFADLGSTHEVLTLLDSFNLCQVSTSEPVMDYLHENGVETTTGNDRVRFLEEHSSAVREIVAEQKLHEQEIAAGADKAKAKSVVSQITARKRLPVDCVDGNVFGSYSNTGTIVDPGYLFSERYDQLLEEPVIDPDGVWQTVLHMMGGTYTFGHDHTYLYRNRFENIPNSYIGTPPDYGVIRPGNFVFHDLKYVENSSIRDNYPLDHFLEYALSHYIDQMDMHTPERLDELPEGEDVNSFIYTRREEGEGVATPMQRIETHVIPFRALKKDLYSSEYYEYGEECYLAELVDIALECDLIAAKAGQQKGDFAADIGGATVGYYTSRMLAGLWSRTNDIDALTTTIDQVLFMQGMQPTGGRETIREYLGDGQRVTRGEGFVLALGDLPTERAYDELGDEEKARSPLTCYYEWFLRNARLVPEEELRQKGVSVREPLFRDSFDQSSA